MKKIAMAHVGLIIVIVLVFVALMIFGTPNARGAEVKRRLTHQEKKAVVQERRERILRNGNIENVYPKKFRIDWFLVNNKAYMGIIFNSGVNRQWQAR